MRLGKRKGAAWLVNTHVGPAHLYTACLTVKWLTGNSETGKWKVAAYRSSIRYV